MKTALIILAVIAALLAAVFCYRHFVTDSIMDKDGMEFDWKADMEGTWVCGESDFKNCTVTIRSGRLLLMRDKKTLYDGRYLLNEDAARLVPDGESGFGDFSYFEYRADVLIGATAADGAENREIKFIKEN